MIVPTPPSRPVIATSSGLALLALTSSLLLAACGGESSGANDTTEATPAPVAAPAGDTATPPPDGTQAEAPSSTAETGAAHPLPPGNPPGVIEVSGVRLGMNQGQVIAALGAGGMPTRPNDNPDMGGGMAIAHATPSDVEALKFVSGIASRDNSVAPGGVRQVNIVFTPEGAEARVWGISLNRRYGDGERPTLTNSADALIQRYGEPSQRRQGWMIWIWNPNGDKLGEAVSERCRIAIHNAYLSYNTVTGRISAPGNVITRMPERDWQSALEAGCGRIITAHIQADREGLVSYVRVDAIDLHMAYTAGTRLNQTLAQRDQQATTERQRQADARRSDL